MNNAKDDIKSDKLSNIGHTIALKNQTKALAEVANAVVESKT